jgi:DNA-binding MarR family transcriptional regulator
MAVKPTGLQATGLDQLIAIVEKFREHNPDVTANQMLTLLYVAREPGITQKATLTRLGLKDSGQSRIVAALSKHGDRGRPGWGVVDLQENPVDRREKLVTLNHKGQLVINAILRCMDTYCAAYQRSIANEGSRT